MILLENTVIFQTVYISQYHEEGLRINAHAVALQFVRKVTSAHTTLPVPQADSTITGKPELKTAAYKPV